MKKVLYLMKMIQLVDVELRELEFIIEYYTQN